MSVAPFLSRHLMAATMQVASTPSWFSLAISICLSNPSVFGSNSLVEVNNIQQNIPPVGILMDFDIDGCRESHFVY